MHKLKLRGLTLMTVLAVAATGCQGGKGAQGDAGKQGTPGDTGPQGPVGPKGDSAVVTGSIEGVITFDALDANNAVAQAGLPASAVTVETVPPVLLASGQPATAQTDATGAYSIPNVPIGVYAVKLSGTGYTTTTLNGVSVVAGKAASGSAKIVSANPLLLKANVANKPFGFDQDVALSVSISGGKGPYTVTWTPKTANATAAAPSGAALAADPAAPTDATKAVATATLHTGTFAAILASNKVTGLAASVLMPGVNPGDAPQVNRAGFVPVSMQQLAQMTYNVDVKVTDTTTKWQKVVTVAVPTASLAQGSGSVPVNTVVIAHLPGNTAATLTGPVTDLKDASGEWPWFVASAEGDYAVSGVTSGGDAIAAPAVSAGNYVGADFVSSTANPANCVDCHSESPKAAAIAGKFKEWSNSAHGNHFFKFMEYDATGTHLQWKAGVTQLPTANPLMFWKTSDMPVDASGNPLPMTTFQFGMMGAEGAHYSSSCMGCHTTGYNAALASNGVDDKISADKWSFDLSKAFAGNLKTASATDTGEPVTVKPDDSVWKLIPADVKAYAGMQCEACHGPLGQHAFPARPGANPPPRREFDVAACAICHDRPTNHDRVALWRQSGHANLEVAMNEGVGSGAVPSTSCNRCHTAQGFAYWVKQQQGGNPFAITFAGRLPDGSDVTAADFAGIGVTKAEAQPQTCAACHDPHSTEIRVSGDTKKLPAGYQVTGAGAGALCMVCHNTRNGARGDGLTALQMASGLKTDGTPKAATSIGGPHEANQTDVYVGANAYWVSGFRPGKHMAVAETCVGCHMKLHPDSIAATGLNHTMKADATICKNCHGATVDGEAIEAQYDAAVAATKATIIRTVQTALRAGAFQIKGSPNTSIDAATAAAVVVNDFTNGRSPAFKITYGATPTTVTVSLGNFLKADGTTPFFDVLFGSVAKANWNYSLVQDGSKSIHNPSFVFEVLSATQANVGGGTL